MTISVINNTGSLKTYVNGRISVAASSTTAVPQGLEPYLALDANFISDVLYSYVSITDGVNIFNDKDGFAYMQIWLNSGVPFLASDPIAFTLAGLGFSINGNASLSNSVETPVLLFRNPNGSGVNARAMYFYASPNATQGIVNVTIYTGPTITSNGSSISPVNNLVQAGAPASAMNLYSGPTVSAKGTSRITVVSNANADASLFNFGQTAILTPGNDLLMTVQVSNLGLLASVTTYFFMQWVEV